MLRIASPRHFTPRSMAKFARLRLERINDALLEIAGCYGDVDNGIVVEIDALRERLVELSDLVDEAEREGKRL